MTREQLRELIQDMTLEEKVGQMIQLAPNALKEGGLVTGTTDSKDLAEEQLALAGSILGRVGAAEIAKIQKMQMERQPHHIPMLFMYDVINGFQTIFPIPLGQGATFDLGLVEEASAAAARESAATGLHVTFSPMLDLVRDARWGRVMESNGEDPYLNSCLAKAYVKGYQGIAGELSEKEKVAACVKHFAAYGASEGGRDYDNVELSERTFREDYLPAYESAINAGSCMVMTSFNCLNRIPASGNRWLMRKVLRGEMGFEGVLISDYNAVGEMVKHGFAEDYREAAKLAIEAGVDIDMVSKAYSGHLAELVRSGEVPESLVNEAVMRILTLKNELGLFEQPIKFADDTEEKKVILCEKHRKLARKMASASFVLLKNDGILPLSKEQSGETLFAGPYVDSHGLYGSWSFPEDEKETITIRQGVEGKELEHVEFAQGCYMLGEHESTRFEKNQNFDAEQNQKLVEKTVKLAKHSDRVVLCLGEHRDQTGEGGSRSHIRIPEVQMELLRRVHEVNPHIVTVLFCGRPLETKEISELSEALLVVWMPGTEGGNAIADVLYGDSEPKGRLPMTFPRSVGQVPIYYNHFLTGRPNPTGDKVGFLNGYIDESVYPQYPFGYGLTYTDFSYSEVTLNQTEMKKSGHITAMVTVTNTGSRTGTETVQMYLRDLKASVIRPIRALRGFLKITLSPGESREVKFCIGEEMLRFYDRNMNYVSEPGRFQIFIGPDSNTQNGAEFVLSEEML